MGVERDGDMGTGDPDRDTAVIGYFGDGATSQGDVNEAFVFASSYNAPIVFFCQNNQWAISEPIERQSRIPLYRRAAGFGFPGVRVDGNDVLAVHAVTTAALERARSGNGPTLIEAYTYRMGAHTTSDDPTKYRLADELEHWRLKDPIERVKAYLSRNGAADDDFFAALDAEAATVAGNLRAACLALPAPRLVDAFGGCTPPRPPTWPSNRRRTRTTWPPSPTPAVRHDHADPGQGAERRTAPGPGGRPQGGARRGGHRQARRRLPGDRGTAEGLRRAPGDRLAAGRVGDHRHRGRNGDPRLPAGLRDPVRRVRLPGVRPDRQPGRQDALPVRRHVKMPMVIRIPFGGGIGAVEHHSESPESYFVHTPGLKVVACANPVDAYWMIQQAVASDDPVIFFEPKRRYHEKADVDESATPSPLHSARSSGRARTSRCSPTGRRSRPAWPRPRRPPTTATSSR